MNASRIDILASVCETICTGQQVTATSLPGQQVAPCDTVSSDSTVTVCYTASSDSEHVSESVNFKSADNSIQIGGVEHNNCFVTLMAFLLPGFPVDMLFAHLTKPGKTDSINRAMPEFAKTHFPVISKKNFTTVKALYLISYLISFNKIDVTQIVGPNGPRLKFSTSDYVRIFREKIASNADTPWDDKFPKKNGAM